MCEKTSTEFLYAASPVYLGADSSVGVIDKGCPNLVSPGDDEDPSAWRVRDARREASARLRAGEQAP